MHSKNSSLPARPSDFKTMSSEGRISLSISPDVFLNHFRFDIVMSHTELGLLVLDLIKMEIWYELGPHYEGGGQQMIFECSREQLPEVLSSISVKIPRMAMTNGGDNYSLFSIRE